MPITALPVAPWKSAGDTCSYMSGGLWCTQPAWYPPVIPQIPLMLPVMAVLFDRLLLFSIMHTRETKVSSTASAKKNIMRRIQLCLDGGVLRPYLNT